MDAEILLLGRIIFALVMFLLLKILKRNDDLMSNLSAFLSQNAIKDENIKYVASKRFVEKDKPVEWEIKSITSTEDESIRKSCTKRIQVQGHKGQYTIDTDYDKYLGLLAVKCIVFPNLNDKELQDSYGVMGADNLLKVMLKPGEYQDLLKKVQAANGFDVPLDEMVEEAKN